MNVDSQTNLLIYILGTLITSLGFWATSRGSVLPGYGNQQWAKATFLQCLGWIFFGTFRGILPEMVSILIGNGLIFGSLVWYFYIFLDFFEKRMSALWGITLVSLEMACLAYFTENYHIGFRIVIISISALFPLIGCAYLLLSVKNQSAIYRFLGSLVLFIVVVVGMTDVFFYIFHPRMSILDNYPTEQLAYIAYFCSAIFLSFCFLLMNQHRYLENIQKVSLQLAVSEKLSQRLQQISLVGHYVAELDTDQFYTSHALDEILGIERNSIKNMDEWCKLLTLNASQKFPSSQTESSHDVFRFVRTHRIVRKSDGMERWISDVNEIELTETSGQMRIIGTIQDITDNQILISELVVAKELAESANRAKSNFLASMSHELRTPLNSIIGFAELLQNSIYPPLTLSQREDTEQIIKGGWHLLDLINEILDLSRIEAGQLLIKLQAVALNKLIDECCKSLTPLTEKNKIKIIFQPNNTNPFAQADTLRLKQVIVNLLSNAIKYNKPGGIVEVVISNRLDSNVEIEISDTGQGISDTDLLNLFEPFTRFGDQQAVQGTGIGLTIARQLLEKMNGNLEVNSKLGEGSRFTIRLKSGDTDDTLPQETMTDDIIAKFSRPISLVYVEDNELNQKIIDRWAKNKGWEITIAGDAASGIDKIISIKPDIILLDMQLPNGFTGFDVHSALVDVEFVKDIPIIIISADAISTDIDSALQSGFSAYITKPIDFKKLELTISELIKEKLE